MNYSLITILLRLLSHKIFLHQLIIRIHYDCNFYWTFTISFWGNANTKIKTDRTEIIENSPREKGNSTTQMITERFLMINNEWPENHWNVTVAIPTDFLIHFIPVICLVFLFYSPSVFPSHLCVGTNDPSVPLDSARSFQYGHEMGRNANQFNHSRPSLDLNITSSVGVSSGIINIIHNVILESMIHRCDWLLKNSCVISCPPLANWLINLVENYLLKLSY